MPEMKLLKDSEPTITSVPRTIGMPVAQDRFGSVLDDVDGITSVDSFSNLVANGWILSSASVRVSTPAVPATAGSWAAATFSGNTAILSSAAYEGDTRLAISGGLYAEKGAHYVISVYTGSGIGVHLVECANADESGYFQLKEPLPFDVPSGAVVANASVRYTLSAAQTAQIGNATIEWKATADVDGTDVDYIWTQAFRIVRSLPWTALTPTRLTQAYPVIRNLRSGTDTDYEETIAAAYDHEILPWLHAMGVNEEDIVSTEALEPAHALACVILLARQREGVSSEFYARNNERFEQLKNSMMGRNDWYLRTQDADVPEDRIMTPKQSNTILLRR